MYILGIETTCDESGIALIEAKDNKIKIINNELALQYSVHQKYGGVVPILAAREHHKNLPLLLKNIEKKFDLKKIDYLAFSAGPGLLPALVSGKEFVIGLAKKLNKKIIKVNHLEAHTYACLINNKIGVWQEIKTVVFPAIVLVVSGGHTNLYLFKSWAEKRLLGATVDDAAGEIIDKCARALGLGYPGGPIIEKKARQAKNFFALPKPMIQKSYTFSFSGLKTAFIDLVADIKKLKKLDEQTICDLSASLQKTVSEILIFKIKKAAETYNCKSILIGGGVSANGNLRKQVKKFFKQYKILFPPKELSTDNGLNIAIAGYLTLLNNSHPSLVDWNNLEVFSRENIYDKH
ncbi:MAG: tRNA N6-adenosine threonylcarbamoyltransferase [Candidatus Parcubacteria bacterium]|nr:MAG: tRNA N6-adenosine threonylcarbamoyltransferase [Candidatus Parcubacteria bacterium]